MHSKTPTVVVIEQLNKSNLTDKLEYLRLFNAAHAYINAYEDNYQTAKN